MIFLTVGSWHRGFDRLVREVDTLKKNGVISEEVLAQIGSSSYRPTYLNAIDYFSPGEFVNVLGRSRIVISHAGMGTIIEAVSRKKTVIVVPRMARLGEANTDHQFDTARQLEVEGKILVAYEESMLPIKIKEAETFIPKQSESCPEVLRVVQDFIESIAGRIHS